ncbi:Hachiman antiphage defense system protein HamA [Pseudomonas aeruginosa]|uniref:Hachiman antiphage defense system protein HamA n=1 Tax=Pseudomonas aeruginosa TaxID=287 RepID=UPI003F385ACC
MLYPPWCDREVGEDNGKQLWQLTERQGGRAASEATLTACIRSHYDHLDQIADDVRELGYPGAAAILAERMPRSIRARSGELGEILATELVEEQLEFQVPVRRLRYKDGREMALRGDDFIGVRLDEEANLHFLKGESKSRTSLTGTTIAEARSALSKDGGRPNATSLLFVADRLLEGEGERRALGRKIRNEVASRAASPARISHMLFTLSGNAIPQAQRDDLAAADGNHPHYSVHFRIADHQAFIRACYERALALGND